MKLVEAHTQATQGVASGIHSLPGVQSSWAATQAAYRFLNNKRVSLPSLAGPLITAGREQVAVTCDDYALVVHDWSQLMYAEHSGKKDRVLLSSRHVPEGYELQTSLLLSDRDGCPLAPVAMGLRAADGVHCSRSRQVRPPLSPLDELLPTMTYLERQSLGRTLIHIIDAEADSVDHYRQWSKQSAGHFLVRADDRLVEHEGAEIRCSAVQKALRQRSAFQCTRQVEHHGKDAHQWVAEAEVRLLRPGQRNRPNSNDRQRIPGPPLTLRLVISEVRTAAGEVLATWWLLTNVPPQIDGSKIALWYYWRWRIESYFKLLKSSGMNMEQWQQETAPALARRLLVASMACVLVWQLSRSQHPQAEQVRHLLVRLSGRQMKRNTPFTMPALLAGLWVLLAMLAAIDKYPLEELREIAALARPQARPHDP